MRYHIRCENQILKISMKFFCVLLLVVSNTLASLTAPDISIEENNSEWKVVWKPVQSSDESDPVLGYKVRVNIYVKNGMYHIVDNPEVPLVQQELFVNGTDTELKVNLSPTVPYEFTVLAYAKSGDGPVSVPKKVTVGDEDYGEEE